MNCYIINFNRLKWPKQMAIDLADRDFTPIFLDNNSTYPPLLDWYDSSDCKFEVIRFKKNHGHRAFYKSGFNKQVKSEYFAMTDPDLDITSAPKDFEEVLMNGFRETHDIGFAKEDVVKVGLNLRIDDLPEPNENLICDPMQVASHERGYEGGQTEKGLYLPSQLDTTFAIYRNKFKDYLLYPSLRTAPPYEVRHLPWYLTYDDLSEEDKYYFESIRREDVDWSWRMRGKINNKLHGEPVPSNKSPISRPIEIAVRAVGETKYLEDAERKKTLDRLRSEQIHLSDPSWHAEQRDRGKERPL